MLIKLGNKIPTIKMVGIGGFGRQTVEEMILSNKFNDISFLTIGPKKNNLEENNNITKIELMTYPAASCEVSGISRKA